MNALSSRIAMTVFTGLGVAVYAVDLYERGSLSTLGWIAFSLLLVAFVLGVFGMVRGR